MLTVLRFVTVQFPTVQPVPSKANSKQARAVLSEIRQAQADAIEQILQADRAEEADFEDRDAQSRPVELAIEADGMAELAEEAAEAVEDLEWELEAVSAAEEMTELFDELEESAELVQAEGESGEESQNK